MIAASPDARLHSLPVCMLLLLLLLLLLFHGAH
jgi:hypothetical protein